MLAGFALSNTTDDMDVPNHHSVSESGDNMWEGNETFSENASSNVTVPPLPQHMQFHAGNIAQVCVCPCSGKPPS